MRRLPVRGWAAIAVMLALVVALDAACNGASVPNTPAREAPTATVGQSVPQAAPTENVVSAQQEEMGAAAAAGGDPTPAATREPDAPTATSSPATVTPTPRPAGKGIVLAYYVPYDATSWQALQARASALDYVGAQWVSVDACGNVGSRDDRTLVAFARERGIRVLPSLLTSSGWLNHRLLTNQAAAAQLRSQIVDYVVEEGYPGFDLDLEGINAEDRSAYSEFVAQLAADLHLKGKLLTLAIPAKASDVRTGWAGPYDYAELGKHADLILLMTYDYSWSAGPPGSIAPQSWVDKVAAYAVSQMPREKVLIGVAFYGYDWDVSAGTSAKALYHPQALALARQYGTTITADPDSRSSTFTYTGKAGDPRPPAPSAPPVRNQISVRSLPQCPVKPPPPPTPRPTPTPLQVQKHVVWFEDAKSVAGRLEIVSRYGVAGVGTWRLGQEDPEVWSYLAAFRRGG